ncbi:PREDICTED: anther-specific proline-rich protein APG-like, partial [Dinoponera quadriceps]|uniref:Anther-specific proline-rich protein APG-like n=1 Tax=Dinoponera quadriceps TaxID=609295 RepID=A0A6P3Y7F9_DINQU
MADRKEQQARQLWSDLCLSEEDEPPQPPRPSRPPVPAVGTRIQRSDITNRRKAAWLTQPIPPSRPKQRTPAARNRPSTATSAKPTAKQQSPPPGPSRASPPLRLTGPQPPQP